MRAPALALLAVVAAGSPRPAQFRTLRAVQIAPGGAPRACAALDGELYAEAAPALADVRLFSAGRELPYALTRSETARQSDAARVLNLGVRAGHIVFDLAMPPRPYSEVRLQLDPRVHDFILTAAISGRTGAGADTRLPAATLFDLASQHLGRSTVIPLPESSFSTLHLELTPAGSTPALAPSLVEGAEVPPSRQGQTLYTPVAETSSLTQRGRETVATFALPARVPVERVLFTLPDGAHTNFSRAVTVTARTAGEPDAPAEVVSGSISRVELAAPAEGLEQPVRASELAVPATLGANLRSDATVEVAVENGDDQPVAFASVQLQMRVRNLCFDVPAGPATLYLGAAALQAPSYDYAQLFRPGDPFRAATLAAARPNPDYAAPPDAGSLLERYPSLVWAALAAAVLALGMVALRSARRL